MFNDILRGEKLLIVGHGNSIRGLMKIIEKLSDEKIQKVNIPTGLPIMYHLDKDLNIIDKKFLGSKEMIEERINFVNEQYK